jgi:hypothetical protein
MANATAQDVQPGGVAGLAYSPASLFPNTSRIPP